MTSPGTPSGGFLRSRVRIALSGFLAIEGALEEAASGEAGVYRTDVVPGQATPSSPAPAPDAAERSAETGAGSR